VTELGASPEGKTERLTEVVAVRFTAGELRHLRGAVGPYPVATWIRARVLENLGVEPRPGVPDARPPELLPVLADLRDALRELRAELARGRTDPGDDTGGEFARGRKRR
jgi:hypothetical protein